MQLFERLKKIHDWSRYSRADFAKKLEVSKPTVDSLTKDPKYNPGLGIIIRILELFPDINANWLLMNEGPMFKANNKMIAEEPQSEYGSANAFIKYNKHLEDEIAWLRKIIEEKLEMDINEINDKKK